MKNIFSIIIFAMICSLSIAQTKQSYAPPVFADADRLTKVQATFPIIEKLYKDFAEKNHFPGYAFGIVLDGKLI